MTKLLLCLYSVTKYSNKFGAGAGFSSGGYSSQGGSSGGFAAPGVSKRKQLLHY